LELQAALVMRATEGGIGMRRHRSKEAGLPWETQVAAAVAEFDSAKAPTQRMAALRKLQPLCAGNGELKAVLRKCLALLTKAEQIGEWKIRAERRHNEAPPKVPARSQLVNRPLRF
jgi:hypothetical protein